MTVQAAVAVYKTEFVNKFEAGTSDLAHAVKREGMQKGLTFTWDVAGTDGGEVTTRGQNGDISYGSPSNTQVTATLIEYQAAEALTGFDIFASQGNQSGLLRSNVMKKVKRHQTDVILAEMSNFTQDFPTAGATMETAHITGALAILGDADVPVEEADNMFAVISNRQWNYLMQTTEFASGDYVDTKPFNGAVRKMWRWAGVNFIRSSRISGKGTSAELCYMWHRDAIGYACPMGEERVFAGFDEKQGQDWARCEIFDVAKVLQVTGGIKMSMNGAAIAAT